MSAEESNTGSGFKIWAVDDVVYGPVDLPTIVEWVKDERVLGETWVYVEAKDCWEKAAKVSELAPFFQQVSSDGSRPAQTGPLIAGVKPGQLRRVKILAEMNDQQLGRFAQFMEVQNAAQFRDVVKQGEMGDSMFLILEGELRVRQMISGKETVLATLAAGEFFGDISLFDHGPRSADVVTNQPSVLLKISAEAFKRLTQDAPELATPFLVAIGKTLTARIRADNKRFRDSISFARAANNR